MVQKQKPAIVLAIAGFKKICVKSRIHSHDVKKTGVALTNGHPAIFRRVLHQLDKRGFHFFQPRIRNPIFIGLSIHFYASKSCGINGQCYIEPTHNT